MLFRESHKAQGGIMNKWIAAGVAPICLACFPPGPAMGADSIRVGVYENHPKVFVDEQGKPAGFWVELLEEIAAREGWQLRYVPGAWEEGLARLKTGDIDLLVDVAYSEERGKAFDFNREKVLANWTVVYGREDLDITEIKDLRHRPIAVMKGGIEKSRFEQFDIPCTFVEVPSCADAFLAVDRGKADAALIRQFYGMAHEDDHKVNRTSIVFARRHFRSG
jgi:ABC-type amino acid transport substrate-binding protein